MTKLAEKCFFGGFVSRLVTVLHRVVILEQLGGEGGSLNDFQVSSESAAGRHGLTVGVAGPAKD